jgi:hypothetical protein
MLIPLCAIPQDQCAERPRRSGDWRVHVVLARSFHRAMFTPFTMSQSISDASAMMPIPSMMYVS